MAEAGLFTGWDPVVRGRAKRALEVFNESIQYYAALQKQEIETGSNPGPPSNAVATRAVRCA